MSLPVALVTGANKGIGRAIALRFAEAGYRLAITGRDTAALDDTLEAIAATGSPEPLAVEADLRDLNAIQMLAGRVQERLGPVEVLVNNAGLGYMKPFLELSVEEFQEMVDVNLRAVFALTREIVPAMVERGHGAVVNIASLAGKNGFVGGSGYAATKFALRGFAASLMLELRDKGIRVITVFPGSVDTRLIGRNPNAPARDSMLQPEDVAHAVFGAVSVDARAMMSEIDIRPSNPRR